MATRTPFESAKETSSCAAAKSVAIGFSMSTGILFCISDFAIGACELFGVATIAPSKETPISSMPAPTLMSIPYSRHNAFAR